jgi:dTDP-4-dehydrorhamnose reductase
MAVKNKVLVLGVTGMLGHMVHRVLAASATIDVHGTHISDKRAPFYFDVMSGFGELEAIYAKSPCYDYFINCIGILPAGIEDKNPSAIRKAIKINSLFPHELSASAKEHGIRVIHISTDGVFSGEAESYYEDDTYDCHDFYGITKSLGEVFDENFLNLRCSIIGPSPFLGEGLMEWFLKQPAGSVVSGYTNHIWHGISTYQFGNLCLKIIEGGHFNEIRRESAVFHFAPNEPITKFDLLCLFREIFEKDVNIEATASEEKIYKRVLQTKYRGLKNIYSYGIPAAQMVSELAFYMKNKGDNYADRARKANREIYPA